MLKDRVEQIRSVACRALKLGVIIAGPISSTLGHGAGVPDLTGTYDLATLTPLQRPVEFGENKFGKRNSAKQNSAKTNYY